MEEYCVISDRGERKGGQHWEANDTHLNAKEKNRSKVFQKR